MNGDAMCSDKTERASKANRNEASLERVLPELEALLPSQIVAVNLDLSYAVITVMGFLPRLTALREDMIAEFKRFDIRYLDGLPDYTRAL